MTIFIECLKRLYRNGKTTEQKIRGLHDAAKITQEELDYILE